MSPEEEEAVQAELEALQREAMVSYDFLPCQTAALGKAD